MSMNSHDLYTESVSAVTATPSVTLQQRRWSGSIEYVYCYNGSQTQIVPGAGVILSANSAGTIMPTSVLGDMCAGVVVHSTLTTGTYGWVASRGPVTVTVGAGAGIEAFTLGGGVAISTAGAFTGIESGSTGSTWSFANCGVALTALAESASGKIYLRGAM